MPESPEHLTLPLSTPGEGEALLPAVPGDDDLAEVVDGVIVEDEPEPQRPVYVLRPVVNVYQAITVVVQAPQARAVARHALYVPGGLVALARGRQRRRSLATALAEQAGTANGPLALQFLQQAELERKGRAERREQHVRMLKDLASLWKIALGGWLFLMIMTGVCLAFAHHRPADVLWPWKTLVSFVADVVAAWVIAVWVLAFGVPLGFAAWLHHLGRTAGLAPRWARTAADDDIDATIDELTITNALANLRIPQIKDYLKLGAPLQFVVGCRQEGRGTGFAVRLPGVPAEKVVRRRQDFAAGLHRLPNEVWPSMGDEAAILKGWIADKGALRDGAGPYPLLDEGFTDVFKGLPFGRTLRGDPIRIPVIGRNSIVGGAPEQGKSNSARVVACGYTLDIITEVRIYVPDMNFDFQWFEPRCSRYLMGAGDEVIEQMLGEQELLKEEIQQRGQLLVDCQMQEVDYRIAHAGVGLHPVFILVEEAHVPITHRKYGKDFGQLLGENVKLCRKRGIHIEVSTQAPVRGAMPRDVTTNCTVGIAHALQDTWANDALLGPGAAKSGHRAMDLMIGADRGTALCKGFAGEARSEVVQVHRIQASQGSEQVTPLVKRALAAMAEQGLAVPGTERGPLAIVSRDLLADLATVLRSPERILVRDALGLLRELAPSWGRYRQMTATSLRGDLLGDGVRTVNVSGTHYLDPADLRAAVARREVCE